MDLHADGVDSVHTELVAGFRAVAALDELPRKGVEVEDGPVQGCEVCAVPAEPSPRAEVSMSHRVLEGWPVSAAILIFRRHRHGVRR